MFQKMLSNRSVALFAVCAALSALTGCGADKAVEVFGQLQVPTPSNPTPQPGVIPPSKALVAGSNDVEVKDFGTNVQAFYFDFSGITANSLDFEVSAEISACPNDPVLSVSLVDFETGSEKIVRDLGQSASFSMPTQTARIKVVVSGLSGCMAYGASFDITKK